MEECTRSNGRSRMHVVVLCVAGLLSFPCCPVACTIITTAKYVTGWLQAGMSVGTLSSLGLQDVT